MGKLRENSILFHLELNQELLITSENHVLNSWHHFWILQFTLHNAIHIAYFISEARMYPTISDISDEILYQILVCICSCCFHFSPGFLWQPLQLVFQSTQQSGQIFPFINKMRVKACHSSLINLLTLHHFTQSASFTMFFEALGDVVLFPLWPISYFCFLSYYSLQATSLATYSPDTAQASAFDHLHGYSLCLDTSP